MTLKEFLIKKGYGPGTRGVMIHKGDENNMYLVNDPERQGVVFESIVEPTIEEVDLQPDTVIRDRNWYIEPDANVAKSARDHLPESLPRTAMLMGYMYN